MTDVTPPPATVDDLLPHIIQQLLEHRDQLDRLQEQLARLAEDEEGPPGAQTVWLADMSANEQVVAIHELSDWLNDVVFVRWPLFGEKVPPCWYRHTAIVDHLLALRRFWRWAWFARRPRSPAWSELTFFTQWLPQVMAFATDTKTGRCKQGHEDDPLPPRTDGQAFRDFLASLGDETPPPPAPPSPPGIAAAPATDVQ